MLLVLGSPQPPLQICRGAALPQPLARRLFALLRAWCRLRPL
jgi:hypothetical protein